MQLDVTAADLQLAAREGYQAVEHVKRYTALGFGTDQGKLGNVNGVAILAAALGRSIARHRRHRVPAGLHAGQLRRAIAGRDVGGLFDPERRTPMHAWHEARGAVWRRRGPLEAPSALPAAGRGHAGRRGPGMAWPCGAASA